MERNPIIGGRCPLCGLYHADKIGPCPNRPSLSPEQVPINPPKVPGTVEDSHAKLAAEMWERAHKFPYPVTARVLDDMAARVEQLGAWAQSEKERVADNMREMAQQQMEAREAEIAKEVKWITEMCERYWNEHNIGDAEIHSVLASIRASAARLGGASPQRRPTLVASEKESAT